MTAVKRVYERTVGTVRKENQRSPIPHEIPPSPAMYVECGGSANSTPSSGYQFSVQVSIEDNFSEHHYGNKKRTLRLLCGLNDLCAA
ncbi:hypothetical protein MSG28_000597 [Choristoneura fumiferana]|uniref:Uncharacterized protein n=1 Tax=Choristoneura fumiferana TaxID=7141 RepID=A0ACC0K1K0_CHOFU|nr:hypothetical protein MSG28_000597 [Choristoneura fumiferana]